MSMRIEMNGDLHAKIKKIIGDRRYRVKIHALTESRIIELQFKRKVQRALERKMARCGTFEPASCRFQLP